MLDGVTHTPSAVRESPEERLSAKRSTRIRSNPLALPRDEGVLLNA